MECIALGILSQANQILIKSIVLVPYEKLHSLNLMEYAVVLFYSKLS